MASVPAPGGGADRGARIANMSHAPAAAAPQQMATPAVIDVVDVVKQLPGNAAKKAQRTYKDIYAAFVDKPYQTGAVALAVLSFVFAFCATFTSWVLLAGSISVSQEIFPGVTIDISYAYKLNVFTTEARLCEDGFSGASTNATRPYENVADCTVVELPDVAPVLQYWYTAGSTSLALLIIALPLSFFTLYITWLRRQGTLYVLPPLLKRAQEALFLPLAHGVISLLLLIAFASYAGTFNGNFDALKTKAVFGLQVEVQPDGTLQPSAFSPPMNPSWGAGFVLAIVAFLCSGGAGALMFVFPNEVSRMPSAAAQLSPGAMGSAYAAGAAATPSSGSAGEGGGAYAGAYGNDDKAGPQGQQFPQQPAPGSVVAPNPLSRLTSWLGGGGGGGAKNTSPSEWGQHAPAHPQIQQPQVQPAPVQQQPSYYAPNQPQMQQVQQGMPMQLQQPQQHQAYAYAPQQARGYEPHPAQAPYSEVPAQPYAMAPQPPQPASSDVPPALPPRSARPPPAAPGGTPVKAAGAAVDGSRFITVATSPAAAVAQPPPPPPPPHESVASRGDADVSRTSYDSGDQPPPAPSYAPDI